MKKVFVVTGQTATGKTAHALSLAAQCNGQLINCDSRQIYQDLNIVTGKDINYGAFHLLQSYKRQNIGYYAVPVGSYQSKVWLYDIITPETPFSSFDYVRCCLKVISHLFEQDKTPIIVGGTYFYLKHLLYSMPHEGNNGDWQLRKKLETFTVSELQSILQKKSFSTWEKMNESDRNNPRRLIRRIEVLETMDEKTFSEFEESYEYTLSEKLESNEEIDISITGFYYEDKERLRETITKRVKQRIEDGGVEETANLLKKYTLETPGLLSIGYKQISEYLNKSISKEQLIEDWSNKEYQYAKRQYTFMKKDKNISWINIS